MLTLDRTTRVQVPTMPETVVVAPPEAPARRSRLRLLLEPLPPRPLLALAAAWPLLLALGILIEPAPADENASVGLIGGAVQAFFGVGLLATVAGLASRRRWGALASLGGALGLAFMTIACPASGHHAGVGAWWFGQLAIAGTLGALSVRTFRS